MWNDKGAEVKVLILKDLMVKMAAADKFIFVCGDFC